MALHRGRARSACRCTIRSPVPALVVLGAAFLGNVAASAATPILKEVVGSDPHGDVKAAHEITAKQRDTVDLTGVSYRVDRAAGTLVVRFDLVDLVKGVAGTQFLGTVVHEGDFDLELS